MYVVYVQINGEERDTYRMELGVLEWNRVSAHAMDGEQDDSYDEG